MDIKLIKATLCEYAPIKVLVDFMGVADSTDEEDVSCTNCKYYSPYGCCKLDSEYFGEEVGDYDICLKWEEHDEKS